VTSPRSGGEPQAFAVEEFLTALTAQLDRAQDTLALKMHSGRPLTWALKDLKLDLKVFVSIDDRGSVRMRSARPNEEGASTLALALTTVTRPMVQENTLSFTEDVDARALSDLRVDGGLSSADRQALEQIGVRTVGQLKRLSREAPPTAVESTIGVPVDRLRAALAASSRPVVSAQRPERRGSTRLLRLDGANLSDGVQTEVRLSGEPVEVVEQSESSLLVRPLEHHSEGQVEVLVGNDRAVSYYRLEPKPDDVPYRGKGVSHHDAYAAPVNGGGA